VRQKTKPLVGNADMANITDNQTAMVRMAGWVTAVIASEERLKPNYQSTCRNRNHLAMQGDILGAYAMGIRSILCLSGDHQQFGDHPQSQGCF
jgi:methylenetetrahydrofolate reductase (NADPH)